MKKIHYRIYIDTFIKVCAYISTYYHLCGNTFSNKDEESCCTTNKEKVTCKNCLRILKLKMSNMKKIHYKKFSDPSDPLDIKLSSLFPLHRTLCGCRSLDLEDEISRCTSVKKKVTCKNCLRILKSRIKSENNLMEKICNKLGITQYANDYEKEFDPNKEEL